MISKQYIADGEKEKAWQKMRERDKDLEGHQNCCSPETLQLQDFFSENESSKCHTKGQSEGEPVLLKVSSQRFVGFSNETWNWGSLWTMKQKSEELCIHKQMKYMYNGSIKQRRKKKKTLRNMSYGLTAQGNAI